MPDPFLPVFVFVLCGIASSALADDVFFRAGGEMRGLVVEEHPGRVVVSTESGEKSIPRAQIDEIFFAEPERNQLYLGAQALEAGDFGGARQFFKRAFQMNPRLLEAEEAMGRLEDMERKAGLPPLADPEAFLREAGLALQLAPGTFAPRLVVRDVSRGSPAQRWGLQPGDVLAAYWGESLEGLEPAEAARRLAGPAGSEMKLTIERNVELPPGVSRLPAWPGMKLEMGHFGLTAREVGPTGAAFLAGIRPGDRVVRMGEASTRYTPLGAARKTLRQAREEGMAFVIHRDLMITREGK